MTKYVIRILLLVIPLVLALDSYASEALKLGTRIPYIADDANLCKVKGFDQAQLKSAIEVKLADYKRMDVIKNQDSNYLNKISRQIVIVSNCLKIDPLIFASLIGHESKYDNFSESSTGAIGLGQLTSISLKEIAQQLHAPNTKVTERGTSDAQIYLNKALACIETHLNNGERLKHWWMFAASERNLELKKNTLLNLSYSAMIYKISYSKTMSYVFYQRSNVISTDKIIKKILNYYNGASLKEKEKHYQKTRELVNYFLDKLNQKSNICYKDL